ncbi:hypothetical protein HDU93_006683 [Gonapodya sp. JEL0774]|nr:hypothetical protein HDU93_006683 [Gonapodya sp. JEL0774]
MGPKQRETGKAKTEDTEDMDEREGKVQWKTKDRERVLLETLLSFKAHRNGGKFSKQWTPIVAAFNQRANVKYSKTAIQNKHGELKRMHTAFLKLRDRSGAGVDPTNPCKVTMSDDSWKDWEKHNEALVKYKWRDNGFPLFVLADQIWGTTAATGQYATNATTHQARDTSRDPADMTDSGDSSEDEKSGAEQDESDGRSLRDSREGGQGSAPSTPVLSVSLDGSRRGSEGSVIRSKAPTTRQKRKRESSITPNPADTIAAGINNFADVFKTAMQSGVAEGNGSWVVKALSVALTDGFNAEERRHLARLFREDKVNAEVFYGLGDVGTRRGWLEDQDLPM